MQDKIESMMSNMEDTIKESFATYSLGNITFYSLNYCVIAGYVDGDTEWRKDKNKYYAEKIIAHLGYKYAEAVKYAVNTFSRFDFKALRLLNEKDFSLSEQTGCVTKDRVKKYPVLRVSNINAVLYVYTDGTCYQKKKVMNNWVDGFFK